MRFAPLSRSAVGRSPKGLRHFKRRDLGKVFLLRQPLPQAVPRQRLNASLGAQDGASRGLSTASTREARPLTPQLAQKQLSGGSNASEARLRAVLSEKSLHVCLDHGAFQRNAPYASA